MYYVLEHIILLFIVFYHIIQAGRLGRPPAWPRCPASLRHGRDPRARFVEFDVID